MSDVGAAVRSLVESIAEEKQDPHFTGDRVPKVKREITTPEMKAVGILYAKVDEGTVSFEVFYEAHIDQAVKDEIAERFGVGSHEWRCSK